MQKSTIWSFALVAVSTAVAASTVSAAFIVDPVSASDNQHYLNNATTDPNASASRTIDGVGLSDAGASLITNSPIPVSYPTTTAGSDGVNFYHNYAVQAANNGGIPFGTGVATYTLGGQYSLTGGHFWQYTGDKAGAGQRDLGTADIYVSPDGSPGSYVFAGALTPGYTEGADGSTDAGVDFSLTGTFSNVGFVELRNELPIAGGNQYIQVAFDEIRFIAVPEPASIGLGAFGLLLTARRRRHA